MTVRICTLREARVCNHAICYAARISYLTIHNVKVSDSTERRSERKVTESYRRSLNRRTASPTRLRLRCQNAVGASRCM